ncbi:MAG: hypothetical protein QOJ69_2020 [Actinomycetota bacterium]|nr:hypothetical protein [Actinomycetota bacterium]
MRRNVIRVLVALVAVFVATVVGMTLTPAVSATPPPPTSSPAPVPPTTEGTVTTTTTTEPEAPAPTTTTVAPATREPEADAAEPEAQAADGAIRPGENGERVLDLQRRLRDLGYWLGTPDGTYGGLTVQAVTAFQKVEGLGRDGIAGPSTLSALDQAGRASARSDGDDLIEVDKAHQVLKVVRDGRVEWVLNVSTGTEKRYQVDGRTELADTPPGRWQVGRVVDGIDTGPLGGLYRPRYFHADGIAVHGYHSVPAYAASHGCVRVSEPAMDWIWSNNVMPVGSTVWVY